MHTFSPRVRHVLNHPLSFIVRVLVAFRDNQGFLLSGAVAFNALLSIIPILALCAVALSFWFEPQFVLESARNYLGMLAPTQANAIVNQLAAFLRNWQIIGLVGMLTVITFSAFAFSALENALSVIFAGHFMEHGRKVWISLLLPYAFILMIGFAFVMLALLTWVMDAMASLGLPWFPDGRAISPWLGFVGEAILFTAIYYVLPRVPVPIKHALIGGLTAAALWELMRRGLYWYFTTLSSVNLIYGTFTTVLVIIFSLEIATAILLLGAQVIREYGSLEPESDTEE
jgi:membrane protein